MQGKRNILNPHERHFKDALNTSAAQNNLNTLTSSSKQSAIKRTHCTCSTTPRTLPTPPHPSSPPRGHVVRAAAQVPGERHRGLALHPVQRGHHREARTSRSLSAMSRVFEWRFRGVQGLSVLLRLFVGRFTGVQSVCKRVSCLDAN